MLNQGGEAENLPLSDAPPQADPSHMWDWITDQQPPMVKDEETSPKRQRSRELLPPVSDTKRDSDVHHTLIGERIQNALNNSAIPTLIQDLVTRVSDLTQTQQLAISPPNKALGDVTATMKVLSGRNTTLENQARADATARFEHHHALNQLRAQQTKSDHSQHLLTDGSTQGLLRTEYTLRGHQSQLQHLQSRPVLGTDGRGKGANFTITRHSSAEYIPASPSEAPRASIPRSVIADT